MFEGDIKFLLFVDFMEIGIRLRFEGDIKFLLL